MGDAIAIGRVRRLAGPDEIDGFEKGDLDRDAEHLAHLVDEPGEVVQELIRRVIGEAHAAGRKVSLCGQASTEHPGFARFLVEAGIDSISVNPDNFLAVKRRVAEAETGAAEPGDRTRAWRGPRGQRRTRDMLRKINDLLRRRVTAADGSIGHCRDFLIDERDWHIDYLLADTSRWLSGDQVLISSRLIGRSGVVSRELPVRLTRAQIRRSAPAKRVPKPNGGGEGTETPDPVRVPPNREVHALGNGHTHSLAALRGWHLVAPDGDCGEVRDFLVEDSDWRVRRLVVQTGEGATGPHKVLLSIDMIDYVDWEEHLLFTEYSAEALRAAPNYALVEQL